jgi:hypothetical protein
MTFSCEWERVARECGTDKGQHTYMPVYERFLGPMTAFPAKILELGIDHGNSLKFWLKMFPLGEVHAIDLHDCREVTDPRLTIYQRFQQDPGIALLFPPEYFDVIIDDCGHRAEWQRISRDILWPNLKVGGYYFIEDILTDEHPEEFGQWGKDREYVYGECNQRNAHESYDRADCLVVLQKKFGRHPHTFALDECLRHPKWPAFFRKMEEMSDPPLTGRIDSKPGVYWGWLEQPQLWRPMWEEFIR